MFQSTPARGGRPQTPPAPASRLVSIHARARRATNVSRPSIGFSNVSIHARARRATAQHGQSAGLDAVSIHARARRATRTDSSTRSCSVFQSTPARGGRRKYLKLKALRKKFQSTPARGGRLFIRSLPMGTKSFNPRPREAGDYSPLNWCQCALVSIHARARRATKIFNN